jgi:ribosomal protein S18 acetylase RimI-like enzyme
MKNQWQYTLRNFQMDHDILRLAVLKLEMTGEAGAIQMETYGDSVEAIAIYQELGFVLEPSRHWVDYALSLGV